MNTNGYTRGYVAGVLHQTLGNRDMLTALGFGALASYDERRGFRDGYHGAEHDKSRFGRVEDTEKES